MRCISGASRFLGNVSNGATRSKLMDAAESDYYGQCAYRSDVIPPQKNQVEELNRTGLDRSASLRLPWGNTRKVVPPTFMSDDPPKKLRRLDRKSTRLNSSHVRISYAVFC